MRRTAQSLDDFGVVPEFTLTAQDGQPFHSSALAGKIWVADFIYTTCPGPCPRMTSQMHDVQDAIAKIPDVKLVSFTVDPATDTPPVLAQYAKVHGASAAHWYFLTGPVDTLQKLDRDAFKLGNVDADAAAQHALCAGGPAGPHSRLLRDFGSVCDSQSHCGRVRTRAATVLIDVHSLPAVNAVLNGTAAILLAVGYVLIRRKQVQAHKRVMLTAFGVSVAFLICYLIEHYEVGMVYYQKTGLIRAVYLTHSDHAYDASCDCAGSGDHHAAARVAQRFQAASQDRPMDAADLDVRERHRSGRIFDAVPVLTLLRLVS